MKLYFKEVSDTILDVKPSKRNECFNWGVDNAFPSMIEALIGMSVTSKTCVDRVAKVIYGNSFGEAGNIEVNSKGQSLNELLRIAARWYAKQNNVFIHVGYDANLDIKSLSVLPTTDCRIGKADDRGYSGKVIVYDNWDKSISNRISPSNFKAYDRFNPDKEVIEKQIRQAAKKHKKGLESQAIEDIIQYYPGQVLHIKKDETFIYALPDLAPVLSEALLENNSQTFRSRGAQKGFLNTKILAVPPFADQDEKKQFLKDLKSLQGANGSNEVLLLETAQVMDDLSKQIYLDDLSGNYNDKLFEYSDSQAEKNICKAYTVPLPLVSQTDNSLFGSSGEMLKEAKIQLWESREEDRNQMEETFNKLMQSFQGDKKAEKLSIVNPYENLTNG